jgi:hypothetical protein
MLGINMSKEWTLFISHSHRNSAALYHELMRDLENRGHFRFQDQSIPRSRLLPVKNPKRPIRKLISGCDVVIAFTRPIAGNSEMMQYELQTATELRKPIIGLRPKGDKYIAGVVRDAACVIIDWDVDEIVRQIRNPGQEPLRLTDTFDAFEPGSEDKPRGGLKEMLLSAFGMRRTSPNKIIPGAASRDKSHSARRPR